MSQVASPRISTMSASTLAKVREFEAQLRERPQVDIATHHVLHGGMYARTIRVPAGVALTGVEIKLATVLVISGHVQVAVEGDTLELAGYHVLPASKGRKQAFLALADTDMTMLFPTRATSVDEAEREFTDEFDLLASHVGVNTVVITGE